jgi:uncharacterized flavoprotein (TIGR03862 family)
LKKKISIVGGGACALMLGSELDPSRFEISIFEKNAALGRKFLVAGEGGLNLSHSEDLHLLKQRYTPLHFMDRALTHFSNRALREWMSTLGIETYVGSSGRIFPKRGIKPIAVLNAIQDKLQTNQVKLYVKHEWEGFSVSGNLLFKTGNGTIEIQSDVVIFCLGGASWPVTGSSGNWTEQFKRKGIQTVPFRASNCAFQIDWPNELASKIEGAALKNVLLGCSGASHFGEVVLTQFGIEGSGIYPLSPQIRHQIEGNGKAELHLDLKPTLTEAKVLQKISERSAKVQLGAWLKTKLKLSDEAVLLLKSGLSKEQFLDPVTLARKIKKIRLTILALSPIEDAISTVGGISLKEITENFELKKMPGYFALGEMLDYDAPTGGYLLQSCFSMGKYLADHLNKNTTLFQTKKAQGI